MHRARVATLATVLALAGTACSSADEARPTTTSTTTTIATPTTVHIDDGVFKVGVVVPTIGPGVEIGISVEAAVRQIGRAHV